MTTPVTYVLQFRGQAERSGEVAHATSRAPSTMLVSVVDRDGPHGHFEEVGASEALYRVRLDEPGPVEGEIDFGGGNALLVRSAKREAPQRAAAPHLRHGAALLEVVGGTGRLASATGWIASNFLLSDSGDLTDNHLGLLFLKRP
ncbi:MAG: hypothetical protein KatS3mg012_2584 [Gaiellaceae bacterium]|nr:MAG: hypothetical protein KatS3mg012_2584 [Gaiellaceae bacterium]